jgi:lipid-binding SYLF domain-containing protein
MHARATARKKLWELIAITPLMFLVLTGAASTAADDAARQQALVDQAALTLEKFLNDPNMDWLQKNLPYAKGIFIVPTLVKAGFFWGGSGGNGIVLKRDRETNTWSPPGFYGMGSVSFGLQIGGSVAEVVMLIMTPRGMESIYTANVKLGGNASVAAGPVGIGAEGATSITMSADMVSFMRAKGAYAGVSLDGALIKISHNANRAYYGREVRPVDIFEQRTVGNPGSAKLRDILNRASR